MAKAAKKANKKKKAVTKRVPKKYEILVSKVAASDLAKKFEDKETTNHHAVVLQALNRFQTPKAIDEILATVKESGRYGKQPSVAKIEQYVPLDLNSLVKEGLVSASEA